MITLGIPSNNYEIREKEKWSNKQNLEQCVCKKKGTIRCEVSKLTARQILMLMFTQL